MGKADAASKSGKAAKGKGKGKGKGGKEEAAVDPAEQEFRALAKRFRTICLERKLAEAEVAPISSIFKAVINADEPVYPSQITISSPLTLPTIEAFCTTFEQGFYSKLKSLCFWNAGLGDAGGARVAKLVRYIPNLQKLEMIDCDIGEATCEVLGNELGRSATAAHLQIIRLDYNTIGTSGLKALSKGACGSPTLKKLSLAYCNVDFEGADVIASLLKHPQCGLISLSLEGNRLENMGVMNIAGGLISNRSLKDLDISINFLGDDEKTIELLGKAAAACVSLASLNIQGNLIGDRGATILARELKEAAHLTSLSFTPFMGKEAHSLLLQTISAHKPQTSTKKKGKKAKAKK